jgi:alkylhydroperoxidase family enzyme
VSLVPLPARPSGLLNRCAAWYSRRQFDGVVVDPAKAASHHSGVLLAHGAEEMVVAQRWKRLDARLRWLAVMAVSQRIGCSWCTDYGYFEGVATGVDPAKIRSVAFWRDSEVFDDRERLVLEFAEAATETPVVLDDLLTERLQRTFAPDELVELAGWIALENQRSRFNAALGLESQGFRSRCELPEPAAHGEKAHV